MTKATIIPSLTNNPPSRANPAAFPTDGDSFLNDLPDVVSGVNTVATELNTWNSDISELQYSAGLSATNASNSKNTALGNARLAASWFLSEWVSGTTYPAGQIVYSNVDGREYKRITAGAGTTDPSSDTANWEPLGWEYITNYPDIRPTLDLNFARSQAVDPRITFTRNSIATYFDKFGVMQTAGVNQPRIDFDPVTGECKGLLIEEQRTNLLRYSEQFGNVAWATVGLNAFGAGSVANTMATSDPAGGNTAYFIQESTASGSHGVTAPVTLVANTTYTLTCYFKAATRTIAVVGIDSPGGNGVRVFFNLSTGVVGSSSALGAGSLVSTPTIVSAGNGWYRCQVVGKVDPAATTATFRLSMAATDGNVIYTGDGTSGVYIWGAQLEAGSFPTSYIPTTSAQATRAADVAVMTGASFSSWYRQDEGTLHADVSSYQGSVFQRVLTIHDGSSNNQIWLTSTTAESFTGYVGGAFQWQIDLSSSVGQTAGAYKTNDIAVSRNGSSVSTDTSAWLPVLDRVRIGASWNGDSPVNGHIKRITYYPKRLPNATLQAITQP